MPTRRSAWTAFESHTEAADATSAFAVAGNHGDGSKGAAAPGTDIGPTCRYRNGAPRDRSAGAGTAGSSTTSAPNPWSALRASAGPGGDTRDREPAVPISEPAEFRPDDAGDRCGRPGLQFLV